MTWKKLLGENRVASEPTSAEEIASLRELAERNMRDARVEGLSNDGRFDFAYGAARALASAVVRAEGYRIKQPAAHYNTFRAFAVADQVEFEGFADYFNTCRALRNELNYDSADVVTDTELEEILAQMEALEGAVIKWLTRKYPDLM